MMKVSVVILNWNGKEMLERFLPSVCRFSSGDGVEVVVADNASDDGSADFVRANFPEVRLIVLDENYGFAEGYNRALKQVDAEYVVLLNSDVEVTENWLMPMVEFLDANRDVAACQPKIRSFASPEFFEHAGACGGFIDRFGYPFCRGRIFDSVEKDEGQYDSVTDLFWATGAALCIRKEVFDGVGGLDAGFFAHMEEIDLCWRLRARGFRIVCVPQCVVFHVGGGTLNVQNPRKTFLNFRNNLLMIYKNEPEESLNMVMTARFFMDYLAAAVFLLKGETDNFKAVLAARKEFGKLKGAYEEKRKENLRNAVGGRVGEIYRRSIVLDFNVGGKDRFSMLNFD